MPLRVVCPEGCRFTAPTRQAGKQVRCPRCRTVCRIPEIDAPTEPNGERMIILKAQRVGDSQPELKPQRRPSSEVPSVTPPPLPNAQSPKSPDTQAHATKPPSTAAQSRSNGSRERTQNSSSQPKEKQTPRQATAPVNDSATAPKTKPPIGRPVDPRPVPEQGTPAVHVPTSDGLSTPSTVRSTDNQQHSGPLSEESVSAPPTPLSTAARAIEPTPSPARFDGPMEESTNQRMDEAVSKEDSKEVVTDSNSTDSAVQTLTNNEPMAVEELGSGEEPQAEQGPASVLEPVAAATSFPVIIVTDSAPTLGRAVESVEPSVDFVSSMSLDTERLAVFEQRRHQGVFEKARKSVCRMIAFCILLVGLANFLLGAWQSGWLTNPATAQLQSWAVVLMFLGALHAAYAAFLAQIADWSAHWVAAAFLLGVAAVSAASAVLLGVAPAEHVIVRWLELPRLLQLKGAIWSICMVLMTASLAWWCGREALYWRNIMSRLQPREPQAPQPLSA